MTNYEKLKQKIQDAVPSLMELGRYTEIIIPKDFSQEHFSYTIIDIIESNSYLDNKKTWEGNKLHDKITKVVIVKNNAISYELERFAVKDCIYKGQEPMLNDVLAWLSSYGNVIQSIIIAKWDLSKPYLKDQSRKLIDLLVGIGS